MKVLLSLVTSKSLDIHVHPVNPVLNETRGIVRIFNSALKSQVLLKSPPLKWLDFFEDLIVFDEKQEGKEEEKAREFFSINDNGSNGRLKSEFELDGTHMNPSYISLLERALNKH
jgi:hypothetical protein